MTQANISYIRRVIYRNNSIVIYYTSPMMRQGAFSYLIPNNYEFIDGYNIYIPDSKDTIIHEVTQGYSVKFTFLYSKIILKKAMVLCAGYINLDKVKYIFSVDGNINDFCTQFILENPATDIDISKGTIIKLNNKTLLFSCNKNSSFSPLVNGEDFYVLANNIKIYPKEIIYDYTSGNTIQLMFEENALSYTGEMTLNTVHDPITKDVFGFKILGDKSLLFQETDTIVLQPGQILPYSLSPIRKNFIIYISHYEPYRTYGYPSIITTITGWVKVYEITNENLEIDESVTFTNIVVNKDMTVYLRHGDLNLNSMELESLSLFRI